MIDLFMVMHLLRDVTRDGHWGSHANSNMRMLYSRCLRVLIRLTLGYDHHIEYLRTLMVARLLNHHPWFHAYLA